MAWKQWLGAAALASGLAVGTGVGAPPMAFAQKPGEQQPKVLTPTDVSLAESVRATLASDKALGLSNIAVSAKDGTVILAGTIESEDDRQRALRLAREVPGVTHVDEDLRIIVRGY